LMGQIHSGTWTFSRFCPSANDLPFANDSPCLIRY